MFRSLLLLPLLLFAGCAGYKLGPSKPDRYKDIKKIAVPTIKNQTLQPRIEVLLSNAIIKQVQLDGTYQVVDEKNADATLEVTLEFVDRKSARNVVGDVLLSKEYTLNLRGHAAFKRVKTGEVLENRSVVGSTSFFASGSSVSNLPTLAADVNQDERQALPLAAQDLAVHIVSLISEGW
jgi:hypothetical protein